MKKDIEVEIKLTKLEIEENQKSISRYEKKVIKETEKQQKKQTKYTSLEEVQEAFGYGEITQKEYQNLCDYFEGMEAEKSIDELFLEHLKTTKRRNEATLKQLENELCQERLVKIARS